MLEQLRLSRGYLFSSDGDQLDFANLIQPSQSNRPRLAVISLAFIPDLGDQQFFVSRLLAEAQRFCRTSPSKSLQVLLVLDEADVFMPATSKPATKEPLLDLLRRTPRLVGVAHPEPALLAEYFPMLVWTVGVGACRTGQIGVNTMIRNLFLATAVGVAALMSGYGTAAAQFGIQIPGAGVYVGPNYYYDDDNDDYSRGNRYYRGYRHHDDTYRGRQLRSDRNLCGRNAYHDGNACQLGRRP